MATLRKRRIEFVIGGANGDMPDRVPGVAVAGVAAPVEPVTIDG